jgi:hypothetical protein
MAKGALPSLKNPVLEALYRRIRDLQESLAPLGAQNSAASAGLDVHSGAASILRAQATRMCADEGGRPAHPHAADPLESSPWRPPRAAARAET